MLRRDGEHLEVISNGVFLMDTRDGHSERLLVDAAVSAHPHARTVLIGGLGVGFTLVEAVTRQGLAHIDVVEIEPALVAWHRTHLAHLTGTAMRDPRVRVVVDDLQRHLANGPPGAYDVVCLDIDNGPDWAVTPENAALYSPGGLATAVRALAPGGVLSVWSARPVPGFTEALRAQLTDVQAIEVESLVPRAEPDVVYLGRQPASHGPLRR